MLMLCRMNVDNKKLETIFCILQSLRMPTLEKLGMCVAVCSLKTPQKLSEVGCAI